MNKEQQPELPKGSNDLQIIIKQLAPFLAYACLFAIILLPFAGDITPVKYVSICFILAHFSGLLHKITKR